MAYTSQNASSMFVPAQNDYAIHMLRQIFGSSMDSLMGVSGAAPGFNGATLITSVIGSLNLAVLALGAVIASYTMYSAVFDTAKDGDVMGRHTDERYTLLRAALGAIALLPVSAGFTVIQIIFLQVLVWGSAAGDYAWAQVVTQLSQSNASYVATANSSDNFITSGKFGGTMRTLVRSQLCALYANQVSAQLQSGTAAPLSPVQGERSIGVLDTPDGAGDTIEEWGFSADPQYNNASAMCGSVDMYYTSADISNLGGTFVSGVNTYANNINTLASSAAKNAGVTAVNVLNVAAGQVAQQIFSGSRNLDFLKKTINTAIKDATNSYLDGVNSAITKNGDLPNLATSLINVSTNDGWVFAPVWQRALSSFAAKLADAKNAIFFVTNDDVNPKAAGSLGSQYGSWAGMGSAEERTLFQASDNAFGFLASLDGTFMHAGDSVAPISTSLEQVTAANTQASSIAPVQWLYRQIFSALSIDPGETWSDPLLQIQLQGQSFLVAGGVLAGGGAAAPAVLGAVGMGVGGPAGAMVGSQAGSALGAVMKPLGYFFLLMGFFATTVLPFLPFAFFLSGVFAWLITSVESLVATSVWCLLALAPTQGAGLVGSNQQGLMLLLANFLRPIMMILGLISCYILMFIGIGLLHVLFTGIYMIMAPGWSLANILIAAGLLLIYMLLLYAVVQNSCAAITGLGDGVMEFIGSRVSALGRNQIGENLSGNLNPAGQMTSSVGRIPGQIKTNFKNAQDSREKSKNQIGNGSGRMLGLTRFVNR